MLIVGAFKGFNFPPFRLPLELARRWKSLLSSLVAESTMFASGGCCRTSSPAPDAACLYFLFRCRRNPKQAHKHARALLGEKLVRN